MALCQLRYRYRTGGLVLTTFSITVEVEDDIEPLSVEGMMDYILLRLESQKVLRITNLVRDY